MSLRYTNNSLAAGFCHWIHDCPLWQWGHPRSSYFFCQRCLGAHRIWLAFRTRRPLPFWPCLRGRGRQISALSRTNYIYNEHSGSLQRGWGRSHDVRLHPQALDLAASSLGFPPISATSIGSVNQLQGRPYFVVPPLCQLFRRRYHPLLLRLEHLKSQKGVWVILAVGWRPF